MKFIDLPVRNQQDFIRTMSVETDIPEQIIEKDWWVSAVMRAIFALPYADAMSYVNKDGEKVIVYCPESKYSAATQNPRRKAEIEIPTASI